jgi:CRISPR/Cas system-associated exonuclease Cas4 (RecB family)
MYLGFKHRHPGRLAETKFGYIDLLSNKLDFIEYDISSEDIDSLEYWCDTIYTKETYVPRRGLTSYCKKCPFDDQCKNWKFQPK